MLRRVTTRLGQPSNPLARAETARISSSFRWKVSAETDRSTCTGRGIPQTALQAPSGQRRHLSTGKKASFADMLKKVGGGPEAETEKVATILEDLSSDEQAAAAVAAKKAAFIAATRAKQQKARESEPKPTPETTDEDREKDPAAAAAGASEAETEASDADAAPDTRTDEEKEADAAAEAEATAAAEEKAATSSPLDKVKEWIASVDLKNLIKSIPQRSRLLADHLSEEAKLAWDELRNPKKASSLERRVYQASSYKAAEKEESYDTDSDDEEEVAERKKVLKKERERKKKEEAEKPKGPSQMVHVKEPTSQWDAMKARLADSPVIREIFKRSKGAAKAAQATDAGAAAAAAADKVKDKIHDAKEFWETSQNPLVYTMSGVWDNITGETEEGQCTKELLKLDPAFNKEEWMEEVRTQLAPQTIAAHMEGNTEFLKMHCGEACFAKLSNDINTRKSDKVTFETKMVDLDENMVIMKFLESGAPVIVCMYMVQQINVIRKDGEVVEGNPNQVIARFYSMAFQQEYDDDEEVVRWRITDYEYGGDMPYY